eukprot:755259-Hanusia_phi.AAC.3
MARLACTMAAMAAMATTKGGGSGREGRWMSSYDDVVSGSTALRMLLVGDGMGVRLRGGYNPFKDERNPYSGEDISSDVSSSIVEPEVSPALSIHRLQHFFLLHAPSLPTETWSLRGAK